MSGQTRTPTLGEFLDALDAKKAPYLLRRVRPNTLMVEVHVPGEHWEVEFFDDGHIEIERYRSPGDIDDAAALDQLWRLLD